MRLDAWHASGAHVELAGHRIFTRLEGSGSGPWVTLLHGFPSSSWDWARVAPLLAPHRRVLALDFIGYGASAKPRDHVYTHAPQADVVEAAWRHFGVTDTAILAHDLGGGVTEELLARRLPAIRRAMFLNGALVIHLNHHLVLQRLLEVRGVGAVISRLITERLFARSFRKVFSAEHPISDDDLHQHWRAISLSNGHRNYHRLVRHYRDHDEHADRMEGVFGTTKVPLAFVWGMSDPVSGPDMLAWLRERVPGATFVELPEVRHYPHHEVPERVAAEFLAFDGHSPTAQ